MELDAISTRLQQVDRQVASFVCETAEGEISRFFSRLPDKHTLRSAMPWHVRVFWFLMIRKGRLRFMGIAV